MHDRMLRPPEVMSVMGWSRTTLWRRIRAGHFPPPVELGPNSIGWLESWVNGARDALPRRTYDTEQAHEPSEDVTP
jgi:prophage regulatory protein